MLWIFRLSLFVQLFFSVYKSYGISSVKFVDRANFIYSHRIKIWAVLSYIVTDNSKKKDCLIGLFKDSIYNQQSIEELINFDKGNLINLKNILKNESLLDSFLLTRDYLAFQNKFKLNDCKTFDIDYSNEAFKLYCLANLWSEMFFKHPFINRGDWLNSLPTYIKKIANTRNEIEYHFEISNILKDLKDNHCKYDSQIWSNLIWKDNSLPKIRICKIDSNYIIIACKIDSLKDKLLFSKIISINGLHPKMYEDTIKRMFPLHNGNVLQTLVNFNLLKGKENSKIEIEISKINSKPEKIIILRDTNSVINFKFNNENHRSIHYFDFTKVSKKNQYKDIYDNLRNINSDGCIIDLRGHIDIFPTQKLLSYLSNNDTTNGIIYYKYPLKKLPGSFSTLKEEIVSKKNGYNKKIVILINERTVSSSELLALELLEKGAIIVGSNSGGSTGAIAKFSLPDKSSFTYTGIGFYSMKYGERTYWNGIIPDIYCINNIIDFENNVDLIIEKAINYIQYEKR